MDAQCTYDNFRYFKNIKNIQKWQSRFILGPRTHQKYAFRQKFLHIKVHARKIIFGFLEILKMYENGKVDSL